MNSNCAVKNCTITNKNTTMDTKALRQKILDLAIHGKLVPQDPNDEPASVLLERIKAEKERLIKEGKIKRSKKPAKTSDTRHYENVPFEVPESWVWCKLEDIAQSNIGLTYKPTDITEDGIPVYRSNNIQDRKIDKSEIVRVNAQILEKQFLKVGDLLICARNGSRRLVGKCAIIEELDEATSFGAFMAVCRSKYNQWIFTLLNTTYFDRYLDDSNSTAINQVTQSMLLAFQIPFPPLAEQKRITAEVERWFALINQIEQDKTDLQAVIKQTKSKILDLAIHGKLVPQDPNDEPAIELLKRINPDFTPCDNGHYPIGWIETILGELFNHNTGKALNSSNKEGVMKDYLTTSNVYWNKFDFTVIKQMPFKEIELDKCTVTKGDLLMCEGGDIGRSAIWNYDYDICIQNHIHRLRPKIDLCVPFYYYTLAYLKENKLIGGKGIGLLGLSSNALHKIEMPLPPFAEQQRIVQKIEELFSSLDDIQTALEV